MDPAQQIENVLTYLAGEVQFVHSPVILNDAEFQRAHYQEQKSDVDGFDTELVDQRQVGMDGDAFEGSMAYELSNGKWFVLNFST